MLPGRPNGARVSPAWGGKARTAVEGRVLRTLHKRLNHRLSAEKGLYQRLARRRKPRIPIGRAGLHDHTQKAQAEAGRYAELNYLSKKEADIVAIQKVV